MFVPNLVLCSDFLLLPEKIKRRVSKNFFLLNPFTKGEGVGGKKVQKTVFWVKSTKCGNKFQYPSAQDHGDNHNHDDNSD